MRQHKTEAEGEEGLQGAQCFGADMAGGNFPNSTRNIRSSYS